MKTSTRSTSHNPQRNLSSSPTKRRPNIILKSITSNLKNLASLIRTKIDSNQITTMTKWRNYSISSNFSNSNSNNSNICRCQGCQRLSKGPQLKIIQLVMGSHKSVRRASGIAANVNKTNCKRRAITFLVRKMANNTLSRNTVIVRQRILKTLQNTMVSA